MWRVVGVDLRGTKTAASIVDANGGISVRASIATPADAGAPAILDAVAGLVRGLIGGVASEAAQVEAVGIGTAGVVDASRGVIISATDSENDEWGQRTAGLTRDP